MRPVPDGTRRLPSHGHRRGPDAPLAAVVERTRRDWVYLWVEAIPVRWGWVARRPRTLPEECGRSRCDSAAGCPRSEEPAHSEHAAPVAFAVRRATAPRLPRGRRSASGWQVENTFVRKPCAPAVTLRVRT